MVQQEFAMDHNDLANFKNKPSGFDGCASLIKSFHVPVTIEIGVIPFHPQYYDFLFQCSGKIEFEFYVTKCYILCMKDLMTKHFSKWASKQNIPESDLSTSLAELKEGSYEANLGGHLYKKRIAFDGKGKRSGGRVIICYKKDDSAIFIHGFAKKEKSNLSQKELIAFKELSKALLDFSVEKINIAIKNGDFVEVKP
jgi:hypothetical protein